MNPARPTRWRDEARLVVAVTGAATVNFVPAAWVVVGAASRTFLMFALMIVVGWALCTALQIAALRWLGDSRLPGRAAMSVQIAVAGAVGVAFKLIFTEALNPYSEELGLDGGAIAWRGNVYSAWSSVLIAVFLVWQREGQHRQSQAVRRLRSVQQAQLAARRGVIESQLQAMQARVDPQHFFDTLDAIEDLFRHDAARAEALFDELIVFLRAALPNLDSAASMLARELDLVCAGARMHALATGNAIALDIDASPALLRCAFPPGLLLPLLRGVWQAEAEPSRIALAARLEADAAGRAALALTIVAGAAPDAPTQQRVRASLQALFGPAAALRCTPPREHRVTTHLRIDHDCF